MSGPRQARTAPPTPATAVCSGCQIRLPGWPRGTQHKVSLNEAQPAQHAGVSLELANMSPALDRRLAVIASDCVYGHACGEVLSSGVVTVGAADDSRDAEGIVCGVAAVTIRREPTDSASSAANARQAAVLPCGVHAMQRDTRLSLSLGLCPSISHGHHSNTSQCSKNRWAQQTAACNVSKPSRPRQFGSTVIS